MPWSPSRLSRIVFLFLPVPLLLIVFLFLPVALFLIEPRARRAARGAGHGERRPLLGKQHPRKMGLIL